MKNFMVLLICFYPLLLQAEKINFDHIFDKELIPTKIPGNRYFWGKGSHLIEEIKTNTGFTLHINKQLSVKPSVNLSSKDILKSFKKLNGFQGLHVDDLRKYSLSPKNKFLLFYIANDYFLFDIEKLKIKRLTYSGLPKFGAKFSPNEKSLSFIEANNLFITDIKSKQTRQLTFEDQNDVLVGKLDWVYQEEIYGRGNLEAYHWSADSQKIVFMKFNEKWVNKISITEYSKLNGDFESMWYPKAGESNPIVTIGLVQARGGDTHWVDLEKYAHEQYLVVGVSFTPDSQNIVYQIQNREQSWLDLNIYSIEHKKTHTLFRENSCDWVDRLQESPYWVKNRFYWISDKTGDSQIFELTLDETFKIIEENQLTFGTDGKIKKIIFADENVIIFEGNRDSLLENHFYQLNRSTGELFKLTSHGFDYRGSISQNGKYLLLEKSKVYKPYGQSLYNISDGTLNKLREIYTPDTKNFEALEIMTPIFFKVPAKDGFEMNAMMIKPNDFDTNKKYPVLSYTYSGPGAQSVTNFFSKRNYLWHQYMANRGYIIWICDNRSSSGKGHKYEATSYKKFGAQELEDLSDGIEFLKQFDWIDHDRMGIWGWSFGGYMTAYSLTHSSLFKLGISVAPVTDWKLYDSVYTERYMGLPVDNEDGYHSSSVLTSAKNLKSKFLLIHGMSDDNVHIHNSVQLSFELQKKNIDFDHIFYAQSKHGLNQKIHRNLYKKMSDFIETHL